MPGFIICWGSYILFSLWSFGSVITFIYYVSCSCQAQAWPTFLYGWAAFASEYQATKRGASGMEEVRWERLLWTTLHPYFRKLMTYLNILCQPTFSECPPMSGSLLGCEDRKVNSHTHCSQASFNLKGRQTVRNCINRVVSEMIKAGTKYGRSKVEASSTFRHWE